MDTKLLMKYHTAVPYKFYFEQVERPSANIGEVFLDKWAKKLSKGKYGWGGVNLHRHKCYICGVIFWTERIEGDLCKKQQCFMKHYGGNDGKSENKEI